VVFYSVAQSMEGNMHVARLQISRFHNRMERGIHAVGVLNNHAAGYGLWNMPHYSFDFSWE
jgi:hypothetical protein